MSDVRNMKFADWINYKVNAHDIWWNAVDPTGGDRDNYYIPLGCASEPKNPGLFTNNPDVNSKLLFYSFTRTCSSRTHFKQSILSNKPSMHRQSVASILDKIYTMTPLPQDEYYNKLGEYKFVVSPEGNGVDCYRHYETWLSKGIPIIQYSSFIANKYKGLPILWTRDYSEINDDYLNKKYNEFLNKSFDFRRVLLSYYIPEMQRQIITVMNSKKDNIKMFYGKNHYWNYHDYFR